MQKSMFRANDLRGGRRALPLWDDDCEASRDMSQPRTIALDAMGGDHGPPVVVAGAAISLERHPLLSFLFFGDEARIAAELEKFPALAAKSHVVHTATTIAMSDKPSQALRRGKGTSLWL